jgi:hypothetical protein
MRRIGDIFVGFCYKIFSEIIMPRQTQSSYFPASHCIGRVKTSAMEHGCYHGCRCGFSVTSCYRYLTFLPHGYPKSFPVRQYRNIQFLCSLYLRIISSSMSSCVDDYIGFGRARKRIGLNPASTLIPAFLTQDHSGTFHLHPTRLPEVPCSFATPQGRPSLSL